MGLRPGESEPPAGFMGELTKISSGAGKKYLPVF